ncbi:plasmid mobilization protein [Acuticoccus yangtzensis]|uniref:plasmid mobilization protein n=1 Tax=Acuticoccus yangtzensis TaxID=1443441 RepID=UPI000D3E9C49
MRGGKAIARPVKDPFEQRSAQVNIRLTAAERAVLEARAHAAGTSMTDFVRQAALGGKGKGRRKTPEPVPVALSESDFALRNELRRIGVNLNQIARVLNADGVVPPEALAAVAEKLDRIFDRLLEGGANGPARREDWPEL